MDHTTSRVQMARLLGFTGLVVALLYVVADRLIEDVLQIDSALGEALEVVAMAAVTSAVLWLGVLRRLQRLADAEREQAQLRQRELERHAEYQRFHSQLHRALDMAPTEDAVYRAARKAMHIALPGRPVELLLADASDAQLRRAAGVGEPACGVSSPDGCPAIRRAQTMVFRSSSDLDACPYLDDRAGGPCGGVCVPVSIGGRTVGVLHAAVANGEPPDSEVQSQLESIADQTGSRVGMLRVMAATALQASTDPLTGLLNRRAFENRVHDILHHSPLCAIAMGDLDHFKRLNDTHGHDTGDRALRLFARVLTASVGPFDVVGRYGGEEFILAFPERTAGEAGLVLEGAQAALAAALADGGLPAFTVSFGVADSSRSTDLSALSQLADGALFRSKRAGRDRVTVVGTAATQLEFEQITGFESTAP